MSDFISENFKVVYPFLIRTNFILKLYAKAESISVSPMKTVCFFLKPNFLLSASK